MSDLQAQDATTAPVEPQSTEPAQQPEAANPATPATTGTEPTDPPKDEGKAAREAMQRRINRLTSEKYQERAQREQLARELEQFRLQQPSESQQPQQQPIPRDLIEAEARRLAAEQSFTQQCNDIVTKGRAEAKDFDAKLTELASITGPLLNERGAPEPLLEALLTTDAPHKVIAHLAAHPDLAAELVDLTPIKQARKLALIEQSMNAKPTRQPTAAPRPLEPVSAAVSAEAEPDPNDTARWIAWRNKRANR